MFSILKYCQWTLHKLSPVNSCLLELKNGELNVKDSVKIATNVNNV